MANHFWVGGGSSANWNATVPTNWSLTSGGVGGATVPSAGDSVFFDANSGTGTSVWNTSISLATLDCTGSKNTITHNNAITLTISSGNLVLPTGVGGTYTASTVSSAFSFTGTSGTQQITTNGFRPGGITQNGAGGTSQLQDNFALLNATSATITLTSGTFDAQNFTVATGIFTVSAINTKVLKGSGAWTIGVANTPGTIWNPVSVVNGLDVSNFTSDVNVIGTTTSTRNIQGASQTFGGRLIVAANTGGGSLQMLGSQTWSNLLVTAPNAIIITTNLFILSNAPTIAGSAGNEIWFGSNTIDTARTFSVGSGTASFSWCAFRDITCLGGATFIATNSFDLGHNSGITITPPIPAGTGIGANRIRSGM